MLKHTPLKTLLILTLFVGCKPAPAPVSSSNPQVTIDRDAELNHKIACKQLEKEQVDQAEKDPAGLLLVDSVFYSSKRNSCLVAKHLIWYPKYAGGRDPEDLEIDDILGGELIFYQHFDHAQDAATISVLMEAQINRLK